MAGRWWWWGLLQGLLAALLFAARHAEALSSTAGTPGVQVTSRDPLVDQVPTLSDEFARLNPPLLSKARWLSLALSDVFLVATCRSEDSAAFNFCVSRSDKVRHDCPPFPQIQNWVGRSFDADVFPPTPFFFVSLFFFSREKLPGGRVGRLPHKTRPVLLVKEAHCIPEGDRALQP